MASGHITSWQIEGEKVEVVTDFVVLGSKTTVDGDCSHEIRRWLLFGRKAMTKLHCVEKQRQYSADKGPYGQSYGLSSSHVWLWEYQRIDAFEMWWWRRHLKVPWKVRKSNQSILRDVNAKYSLEGLMVKLKLQYFGHLMGTGLEKVSFHSNPKERQCQRMLKLPHNCTHLTR